MKSYIGNLYRETKEGTCVLVKANILSDEAKAICESSTWPQDEVAVFVMQEDNQNYEMNRELAEQLRGTVMIPPNGQVH